VPWGALVAVNWETPSATSASQDYYNFGGCFAAADSSKTAQSCATAFESQIECAIQSCATTCSVPANTSAAYDADLNDYETCVNDVLGVNEAGVATGICSMTYPTTSCDSLTPDSGPQVAECLDAISIFDLGTKATVKQQTQALNEFFGVICAAPAKGDK
jgi:hypothetical protein